MHLPTPLRLLYLQHGRQRLAMALAACAMGAQAQSGYTLSNLNRPSGYDSYTAATMDNNGLVRGYGTQKGPDIVLICPGTVWFNFRFCVTNRFSSRELSWASSTSAAVAATTGTQNFGAVGSNDRGTIAGVSVSSSQSLATWSPTNRSTDDTASPWSVIRNTMDIRSGAAAAFKRGNTVTRLPSPPLPAGTTAANYQLTIDGLNQNDVMLVNLRSNNQVAPSVPYRYQGGVFTPVSTVPPEPEVQYVATAISDLGDVAGYRSTTELDEFSVVRVITPLRWVNGVPEPLGGAELSGYVPTAINNSGQIILNKTDLGGIPSNQQRAGVWFNGRFTPITFGVLGSRVAIATAQNNRGDVVGCGDSPFLWRNGQVTKIADLMRSSGLSLPAGSVLNCPAAINDKGSILLSYYPSSGSFTDPTAIRLNAKP